MSERSLGEAAGAVVNNLAERTGRVRQFPSSEEQVNQIVATPVAGEIMESVIAKGDLGKLSPEERSRYYLEVCKSVGLNPLTQPFSYIVLNGKLTLYALRGCTDQLRSIHKVSVEDLTETERGDVFIVTAKVKNGEGRTDMAKGAVTIGNLKGDALANMIMKAETKAKRRATLSICGLGVLDEMEIETIPGAGTPANNGAPKRTMKEISANKQRREAECKEIGHHLQGIASLEELDEYKATKLTGEFMDTLGNAQWAVEDMVAKREAELKAEQPEPLTEAQWLEKMQLATTKDELLKIGTDIEAALPEEAVDRLLPAFRDRMKAIKAAHT